MKKLLLGLLLVSGVGNCFGEEDSLVDDLKEEFSFAAFSLENLKQHKRQLLAVGGVAIAALGFGARGKLGEHLPQLVTDNVNADDLCETASIMGGLAAGSALFNHGPKGYGKLLPGIATLAITKQVVNPGVSGRHELKTIVGSAVVLKLVGKIQAAFEGLFD